MSSQLLGLPPARYPPPADRWLVGGGEMGKIVRSMDWASNPLGPIDLWPQALRTAVGLCLSSTFPTSLAWGPKHIQIYNDAYRPLCGSKHPRSMGQDFFDCWADQWPALGEAFERALGGASASLDGQRMFLERHAYLEETCFTFSFSPVRDESGDVGGVFHPVTETTAKMLGERRMRALHELTSRTASARTTEDVLALAAETLAECELDVPFALFYLCDVDGTDARLVAQSRALGDTIAIPRVALQTSAPTPWGLGDVARTGEARQIDDLEHDFGPFSCTPYPETPKTALSLPIFAPGSIRPLAILVAGVSPRLPLTETYRVFYDIVAAAVATAFASASAHEEERRRPEALAESDRAKTAFYSNVSHEFRTLLDFSRIESERIDAYFAPIDLSAYTSKLASGFRAAVENAGLQLVVDCPPLPEPVYVDSDMWEKVVLNLLSNALEHTFDGRIGVTLRWASDHVELEISDSGVGIGVEELPHLFDRFHQVKRSRSRTPEGTTIGLALAQELTRAHGGTVSVQSSEGVGSTFVVTVRTGYAHLPADRVHIASSAPPSAERTTPQIGRPRIVWADDNPEMRHYVSRLLESAYDVVAVSDGVEALDAVRTVPPDLLITDSKMPGLDGLGLVRAIRSDDRTRAVPVIILSAHADQVAAGEGLDAGADDYLAKPFAARELLARVGAHVELGRLRRDSASWSGERWMRALVRYGADLMSIADAYGVIKYVAPSVEAILGYTPDEIVGRRWREFAHPSDEPATRHVFVDLRHRAGAVARAQYRLHHKDGTWRWMDATGVNMLSDSDVTGIVVNQRDVTERRKFEDQARHSQKLDAIGQLAGGVAHDFNNMLAVILGVSDLIDPDRVLSAEVRQDLLEIRRAAERAASITRQLLAFSRRQVLVPRVVDLNDHIRSMSKMLQRLIGEQIRVVEDLDATLHLTLIDPGQIEQVIVNLAVNARDAMPNGGVLTLQTRNVDIDDDYARRHVDVAAGPYVVVIVADTGSGMDAETRARLFEPFYTTKERGRGTGLGLAMVHGVVRQSGGHIWVSSELGKGTTFRLYFPRAEEGRERDPRSAGQATPGPRGSETILVVEDDDDLRRLAVRGISSQGYRVLEANGSDEALAIAKSHPAIALVVTDVIMPGLNGRELMERLRVLNPTVKAIFTSGYTDNEIGRHGMLEKGVHFVQKPFSMYALLNRVRNVLDGVAAD